MARVFIYDYNGLKLEISYNITLNRYRGKILNWNILHIDNKVTSENIIYGDTPDEVLERFLEIYDNIFEKEE